MRCELFFLVRQQSSSTKMPHKNAASQQKLQVRFVSSGTQAASLRIASPAAVPGPKYQRGMQFEMAVLAAPRGRRGASRHGFASASVALQESVRAAPSAAVSPKVDLKPASDVLAGAMARAASQSTIHPLDTLKVALAASVPVWRPVNRTIMRSVHQTDGGAV